MKAIYRLLLCIVLCTMASCNNTDEIVVYYKMGFIASPVSKSFEDFEKEADSHPVDTVIYIEEELLNKYNSAIKELRFADSGSENIHDYFIDIRCKNINIAMPLPVPDSLNEKIVTYTEENKQGEVSDSVLYELLCAARYFDFFDKEDLLYHPLVRKFGVPSDYTYYYERSIHPLARKSRIPLDYTCYYEKSIPDDISIRIKSRYKVILRVE